MNKTREFKTRLDDAFTNWRSPSREEIRKIPYERAGFIETLSVIVADFVSCNWDPDQRSVLLTVKVGAEISQHIDDTDSDLLFGRIVALMMEE